MKYKVADLFAGAGGFGLGFSMVENYEIILSLEVDKWAADTLRANNRNVDHKIIQNDIRSFDTPEKILEVCSNSPDLIIGGPPCQGFSIAGPVKDPKDPRNSLFRNFAHWVKVLRPKIFVMENVKGLLIGRNERGDKVIDIVKDTFTDIGYTVNVWKLNAANFGVPQNRERVFVVGTINNILIPPPPISHYLPEEKAKLNGYAKNLKRAITVIEAIGDLPELSAGSGTEIAEYPNDATTTQYQIETRGTEKSVYNHVAMAHTKRMVKRYEEILKGNMLHELGEDLRVRKRNGNGVLSEVVYSSNYRHLKPNMISYTIPASFYSNFIHPNQPRNITSREAARLQSFPDYYIFKGKRTQISSRLLKITGKDDENYLSQYNQIGNAVPPLLAKAIAKHLLQYLEDDF